MHSIDFLLIIPECFQIALINFFLLFAICFSFHKKSPPSGNHNISLEEKSSLLNPGLAPTKGVLLSTIDQTNGKSEQNSQNKNSSKFFGVVKATSAFMPTPIAKIEPIIQLIVLALVCSLILYINCPVVYAVGLTDSIIWDSLGRLMSILICVSASGSLVLSIAAISRFGRYEFLFIMWLSIIGMLCPDSSECGCFVCFA